MRVTTTSLVKSEDKLHPTALTENLQRNTLASLGQLFYCIGITGRKSVGMRLLCMKNWRNFGEITGALHWR